LRLDGLTKEDGYWPVPSVNLMVVYSLVSGLNSLISI